MTTALKSLLEAESKKPSLAVLKKAMAGIDSATVFLTDDGAPAVRVQGQDAQAYKAAYNAVTTVIVARGWSYGEEIAGRRTTFVLYDDAD